MKKICELIRRFNDRYFYFCEMHPILSIFLHLPFLASTKGDKIKVYYSPYDFRWKIWYYIIKPKFYASFVESDVKKHCELVKGEFSPEKCDKKVLANFYEINSWWDYVMAHNNLPKDQQTDWLKEFEFTNEEQVQEYCDYWTKLNMMSNLVLRSNEHEYYMGTANYGPMETPELRAKAIEKVNYGDGDEIGLIKRILPKFHRYTYILWLTGRWHLIDYIKDTIKYGILNQDPVDIYIPASYKDDKGWKSYPRYYLKFTDSYWHSYPDTLKKIINDYLKEENDKIRQMIDHAHGEKTIEEIEEEMRVHRESITKPRTRRRRTKKSDPAD